MTDTYTRILLTVIAVALCVIALRGTSPVPAAHAAEVMECRFSGPLEISRINGKVQLEAAHGEAGSSSSYPLYVKQLQ